MPPVTNFNQINPNPAVAQTLKTLYQNVNNIDAWVGMLAEKHAPGSSLGPTHIAVLRDQFKRLRDGDRFWYQNRMFAPQEVAALQSTRLSDILQRNSGVTGLQQNVFFAADLSTP